MKCLEVGRHKTGCFANDLERPFDRELKFAITKIVLLRHAIREVSDRACRIEPVPNVVGITVVRPHTKRAWIAGSPTAGTDS